MIPYSLKSNGTEVLKFSIPESWEESTLRQMIQWKTESEKGEISFPKQLEIMTGIPETDWMNCRILTIDNLLLPHLEWMKTPLVESELFSLPVPDKIMVAGKQYEITKNIDFKSFAQKITFQSKMAEYAVKDKDGNVIAFQLEFFPIAIAIYLFEYDPPLKPFVDAKAFEFAKDCELLTVAQGFPLASFFLNRFLKFSNVIKSSSTTNRMNKSNVQELIG